MFNKIVESAKKEFPKLQIKFKNESLFMKILGFLLFFNRKFMTNYITTIGSTVYFPNKEFVEQNDKLSSEILLHELVHMYDSYRLKFLFSVLYLFPQILVLLFIPMLFVHWVAALLCLLFLLPLPAYFRMIFERRAYLCSLYIIHKMGGNVDLAKESIIKQFVGPQYYFMWIFGVKKYFDPCVELIKNNHHPYQSIVFESIDRIYYSSGE